MPDNLEMLDINADNSTVEVKIAYHSTRVWINVDGKCVVRINRIKELEVDDWRYPDAYGSARHEEFEQLEKEREQREFSKED
jgi:hypothetical protein